MLVPTHLTSSNLDVAGYRQGRLFIRFKSGCTYSYDRVPFECYQGLVDADSCGQFFHREIRGKYQYTKMEQDPFSGKA